MFLPAEIDTSQVGKAEQSNICLAAEPERVLARHCVREWITPRGVTHVALRKEFELLARTAYLVRMEITHSDLPGQFIILRTQSRIPPEF